MQETTTAESIEQVAAGLGLTMRADFVPFSRSRNSYGKKPAKELPLSDLSLNWRITILRNFGPGDPLYEPREILSTDYSAGIAHCPSYAQRATMEVDALVRGEVETGKKNRFQFGKASPYGSEHILPRFADVLYSLAQDASVIDAGTFEEWAGDLGYDTDSRKAEGIYRACLEIALKLRNGLGEDGLATLRAAVEGY